VALVVALGPVYRVMCAVSYLLTAMAIEPASKYGAFFIFFFGM
jgi:hypothetical protein